MARTDVKLVPEVPRQSQQSRTEPSKRKAGGQPADCWRDSISAGWVTANERTTEGSGRSGEAETEEIQQKPAHTKAQITALGPPQGKDNEIVGILTRKKKYNASLHARLVGVLRRRLTRRRRGGCERCCCSSSRRGRGGGGGRFEGLLEAKAHSWLDLHLVLRDH